MRAKEFIKTEQQVDEILPALGAAASMAGRAALAGGSALARGATAAGGAALRGLSTAAKSAGSAISRGARQIGKAAVSTAGRAIAKAAADQPTPQQQQLAMPKPGQMYNHPAFGRVKVLPLAPGEKGLKLDTSKALGHSIVIPPNEIGL